MSAQFKLSVDQRSDLKRLVRNYVEENRRTVSDALTANVESSVAAWSVEQDLKITAKRRDQISGLVALLTSLHRPKMGLIRARVGTLSPGIEREIESRIGRLLLSNRKYTPLGTGLKTWAKTAKQTELLTLLRGCLMDGGRIVPGRKRSHGKQSDRKSVV